MVPFGQNNDEWVAGVASYMRNAFGNKASDGDAGGRGARACGDGSAHDALGFGRSSRRRCRGSSWPMPTWKLTASHNSSTAPYALGIQPWTSGVRQAPGMWIQVELPQAQTLSEIVFESNPAAVVEGPIVAGAPSRTAIPAGLGRGGRCAAALLRRRRRPSGYPRGYQVQVSIDGTTWSAPVAQGQGSGATTHVSFAPVQAKFVRLTQTAQAAELPPLSILRLKLFGPGR